MNNNQYYENCCNQRLKDLIYWVNQIYSGQTINGDFVFRNARLKDIAKGSAATQRIIDWCKKELTNKIM